MRLHFRLSSNDVIVPFNYMDVLIKTFHKWMGWNDIHDDISLYSLSWLQRGQSKAGGLNFPNGSVWFISSWDENISKRILSNAIKNYNIGWGMQIIEIQIQDTPDFSIKEKFNVASPVFIRKYDQNNRAIHLTLKDKDVDHFLTQTLKRKLQKANLNVPVKVSFDKDYPNPKTKLVKISGIDNRAIVCPIIIEGSPEAVQFAWNVGVGHLTGCGFGSLY